MAILKTIRHHGLHFGGQSPFVDGGMTHDPQEFFSSLEPLKKGVVVVTKAVEPGQPAESEHPWITAARQLYGVTHDASEAGYILPNGDMLDFSGGKHGSRPVEHEDIRRAMPPENPWRDFQFQTGAIRVYHAPDRETGADLHQPLTPQQHSMLMSMAPHAGEAHFEAIDETPRHRLSPDAVDTAEAFSARRDLSRTPQGFRQALNNLNGLWRADTQKGMGITKAVEPQHPYTAALMARYGTTNDPQEAGFVAPDGTMIPYPLNGDHHQDMARAATGTTAEELMRDSKMVRVYRQGGPSVDDYDGSSLMEAHSPTTAEQQRVFLRMHRMDDRVAIASNRWTDGQQSNVYSKSGYRLLKHQVATMIDDANVAYHAAPEVQKGLVVLTKAVDSAPSVHAPFLNTQPTPHPERLFDDRYSSAPHTMTLQEFAAHRGVQWHGTAWGEAGGGPTGLVHTGTWNAAHEALAATVAGQHAGGDIPEVTPERRRVPVYRHRKGGIEKPFDFAVPKQDGTYPTINGVWDHTGGFAPNEHQMEPGLRPQMIPMKIVGPMASGIRHDFAGDRKPGEVSPESMMRGQLKRGITPKRGYWYKNESEGVEHGPDGKLVYSTSAVLPNRSWLKTHEELVRDALADGKEVPGHVLADYPHLVGSIQKGISTMKKATLYPNPPGQQRLDFPDHPAYSAPSDHLEHHGAQDWFEGDEWNDLKQNPHVYHVTTNRSAVLRDGLRARTELSGREGLGGGTSDPDAGKISVTYSPQHAQMIASTLKLAGHAVRNTISAHDLMDQYHQLHQDHGSPIDDDTLDDELSPLMPFPGEHDDPKAALEADHPTGEAKYALLRQMELAYHTAQHTGGERHEGYVAPAFMSSPYAKVQHLDPNEVAVLKVRPHAGAASDFVQQEHELRFRPQHLDVDTDEFAKPPTPRPFVTRKGLLVIVKGVTETGAGMGTLPDPRIGQRAADWLINRNGENFHDEPVHEGFLAPNGRMARLNPRDVPENARLHHVQAAEMAFNAVTPGSAVSGGATPLHTALHHGLVRYDRTKHGLSAQADQPLSAAQKASILKMNETSPYFDAEHLTKNKASYSRVRAFFTALDDNDAQKSLFVIVKGVTEGNTPQDISPSGFYSNVRRTVAAKLPERFSGQQLRGVLSATSPEEQHYSGVGQHFDTPKLTKQDVLSTIDRRTPVPIDNKLTGNKVEYRDWSTPGLVGYTENRLSIPVPFGAPDYTSPHWHGTPVPNTVASIRHGNAKDTEGNPVTHVDEFQSDLHQEGRDKGYMTPETREASRRIEAAFQGARVSRDAMQSRMLRSFRDQDHEARMLHAERNHDNNTYEPYHDPMGMNRRLAHIHRGWTNLGEGVDRYQPNDDVTQPMSEGWHTLRDVYGLKLEDAEQARHDHAILQRNGSLVDTKVPDAPFKKNWHELAFKRAVTQAIENGSKRLTWTTGDTQNDRYGLHHHIDEVNHFTENGSDGKPRYSFTARKDGQGVLSKMSLTESELRNHLGHELAQKIIEGQGSDQPKISPGGTVVRSLPITSMTLGGDGMRGFYDDMMPRYAAKFGKRFGAEVGKTEIVTKGKPSDDKETLGPLLRDGMEAFERDHPEEYGEERDDEQQEYADVADHYTMNRDPVRLHRFLHDRGYMTQSPNARHEIRTPVHYLDITPAMRGGLPLWGDSDTSIRKSILVLTKAFDFSQFDPEGAFQYGMPDPATGQRLADRLLAHYGQHYPDEERHEGYIAPNGRLAAVASAQEYAGHTDAAKWALQDAAMPRPAHEPISQVLHHGLVRYVKTKNSLQAQADQPLTPGQRSAIMQMNRDVPTFHAEGQRSNLGVHDDPRAFFAALDKQKGLSAIVKAVESPEHPYVRAMVDKYGLTSDPKRCAFITPDGHMIPRVDDHMEMVTDAIPANTIPEQVPGGLLNDSLSTVLGISRMARVNQSSGGLNVQTFAPLSAAQQQTVRGLHQRGDSFTLSSSRLRAGQYEKNVYNGDHQMPLAHHVAAMMEESGRAYHAHDPEVSKGLLSVVKAMLVILKGKAPEQLDIHPHCRCVVVTHEDGTREWQTRGDTCDDCLDKAQQFNAQQDKLRLVIQQGQESGEAGGLDYATQGMQQEDRRWADDAEPDGDYRSTRRTGFRQDNRQQMVRIAAPRQAVDAARQAGQRLRKQRSQTDRFDPADQDVDAINPADQARLAAQTMRPNQREWAAKFNKAITGGNLFYLGDVNIIPTHRQEGQALRKSNIIMITKGVDPIEGTPVGAGEPATYPNPSARYAASGRRYKNTADFTQKQWDAIPPEYQTAYTKMHQDRVAREAQQEAAGLHNTLAAEALVDRAATHQEKVGLYRHYWPASTFKAYWNRFGNNGEEHYSYAKQNLRSRVGNQKIMDRTSLIG